MPHKMMPTVHTCTEQQQQGDLISLQEKHFLNWLSAYKKLALSMFAHQGTITYYCKQPI